VPASVNLPLHHKVQNFSSGTGSSGWSWKKAVKRLCRGGACLQYFDTIGWAPGRESGLLRMSDEVLALSKVQLISMVRLMPMPPHHLLLH